MLTRSYCFPRLCQPASCFKLAALPHSAFAQESFGGIGGVTRDSTSSQPVAQTQITAHNLDKNTDRTASSGADGVFSITNLEPGRTKFESRRMDFRNRLCMWTYAARQTAQLDLKLQAAPAPLTEREKQLLERVERLEARLAAIEARDASAPPAGSNTASQNRPLVASTTPIPAAFPAAAAQAGKPAVPQPPTPVAPAQHIIPDALQAPEATQGVDNFTPFAYGDFTWLNGSPRNKDTVLDTKFFTPEIRFDTHYMTDFNQPIDHTIVGATESFRSGEVQIEQASVGGDFHWENVRGRILFMEGLFATTTPRNDASSATGSGNGNTGGVGQWDLQNAYKYVSEAYGGYHFNVQHGLNVDAGIFVSYIGLFSYYNFDNWTYQPSYVSSNTPWFFNGVRVQWFPTNKLKIEPWFINGWQSYAKFNGHPGLGGQLLWMPKEWFKLVANQYGYGEDNLGLPKTQRIHTDDSIEVRYYNNPESLGLSKMAFSLTGDAGCEYGGGITCHSGPNRESFVGWMLYDRMWFHKDLFGLTLGGGDMSNYGRYLTLLPPIDGAWAASGTPYFTENPGQKAHMWDSTVTLQYMPKQYITWWGGGWLSPLRRTVFRRARRGYASRRK